MLGVIIYHMGKTKNLNGWEKILISTGIIIGLLTFENILVLQADKMPVSQLQKKKGSK